MRSTRQTKSKQESRPNELTVCELVDTLRNARPNQFVTVFHELPEPVLLQLLHKLTTLDESSLLKLFAIQYTLPINYYDGLRKLIIDYYSHSDAVLLALFDLIDALNSSYYTRALFLDFGGKYPHNVLTQITRSRSATVIKKALSVVLRLNHVHRDDVLRTPLVDYRLEQTAATQVTGSLGNSYHIYYQATPIIAAFERTKEPHIALALVQTLNNRLDSRECLIREDILQKALAYNNELVVCYLLEQPHFHVDPSKIDPIKTRDPHVSDRINALLKSTPFYRALHKNTITTLPDHIKNDTRQTPLILKSRWSEDNTLLHLAAVMNHLDALKFLLSQSLDLDAVNANGLTALHLALNKDCKESISLLIEHGKASLHLAGVDGIWPLQHIMRYNQYELAKTSLRILLRSLPHEAVFSSLSCALNDVAIRPCSTSHVNDVSLSMGKLHPDISLYEALSNSCKTANDATGALLQAVATLYNSAQNPVLNRAVDNFLHHQLHVLLDNPSSHHQNSSRLALIVFLFSQPTQYISGVLNRLSKSAHEQTQLELVLIQALTKPLIYTKLSYETQQKLMTFFAPTSGSLQHLIATHFQRSNLALLPSALLRDFSNHSTPRALYEALQQRVDPILMQLVVGF